MADRELPLQGSGSSAAACDHEDVPRGTAARGTTRYRIQLTVPRRGGWRARGPVRAGLERALADPPGSAIAAAEIASEHRRGADYVRVTVVMTVDARDVADALAIAWDAFRSAARDDLAGWEVTAATAEVQPEPPLIRGQLSHSAAFPAFRPRAGRPSARDEVALQLHPGGQGEHVAAFLPDDGDRILGERAGDFLQRQAVQPTGQLLVVSRVHAHHSRGRCEARTVAFSFGYQCGSRLLP